MKFYLDQVKETSLEEKEREALEGESPSLRLIFKDVSLCKLSCLMMGKTSPGMQIIQNYDSCWSVFGAVSSWIVPSHAVRFFLLMFTALTQNTYNPNKNSFYKQSVFQRDVLAHQAMACDWLQLLLGNYNPWSQVACSFWVTPPNRQTWLACAYYC